MRLSQAKVDIHLLDTEKKSTQWFTHSAFQTTFNLTNGAKDRLILVAPDSLPELPGGIYLPMGIFNQVFEALSTLKFVKFTSNQILFTFEKKTIELAIGSTFDSTLDQMNPSTLPGGRLFLKEIQQLQTMTGFEILLKDFTSFHSLALFDPVKGLFTADKAAQEASVTYLVGRGKGLTPSGDDFLIGWLLIQQLCGNASLSNQLILEKAESPYYTTDVSRHYLRQSSEGRYSQALLQLADYLVQPKEEIDVKQIIEAILAHGQTSGADTLAGITATLVEMRRKKEMAQRVVMALGGNAILRPGQEATVEVQMENIKISAEQVARIEALNYEVVLTHGNGPQVGNILQQNEIAKDIVPPFPLDVCNAESQGFIGYMLEQSIKNRLSTGESTANVVTLLTQIEVDEKDPAFQTPTKPIGVFYTEEEAKALTADKGWVMMEDAGRGYRRAVASPLPVKIHGIDAITTLAANNMIVIAGGGGGIPVTRDENGQLTGLEAVIDKDRTGKKLAEQVDADVFMMLTDVPNVYINWGKPNQQKLEELSVEEAQRFMDEGHFADGSMGPKMGAAIDFARGGRTAIVCALDEADLALQGKAGTRIVG
ncbi:hypothetical protein GCM10011482_10490 [Enterococcus alcedinis]|uniref:Carbamate kinase n=2 Tax=Enterococcus TaxID=1350 RepID=A0A917JDT4_9ENTE|nr:carbamate kinase [Enterococcus alcedinis]GGI65395.1 hypothetical protein GCM10011482_10490 [Enterococcus alcedinis]